MLNPSQLALAVAHADVAFQHGFSASHYLHTGEIGDKWFKDVRILDSVPAPLNIAERAFIVVNGDVLSDINVAAGIILVHGNVRSSVRLKGISELVIAGNVHADASISGDEILSVFVGGDFFGQLRCPGSCKLWVEGNLSGAIWTGHPSTELRVMGDCTADMRPHRKASLLFLEVKGFMAFALLKATAAFRYTVFNASLGMSDRSPGLYPKKSVSKDLKGHWSSNRWAVRAKR